MESEFASWMDRFSRENPRQSEFARDESDAAAQLLQKLGAQHEVKYLERLRAEGTDVCDIDEVLAQSGIEKSSDDYRIKGFESTLTAMRAGRQIIYQGSLQLGDFAGRSDFLIKVEGSSNLGAYHYQVWDTKLACKAKPYFLIQLCCYAEMLEEIQGVLPEWIGVILGDGTERSFRLEDFLFYYCQLRDNFLKAQEHFDAQHAPLPNGMANHGQWQSAAEKILEEKDHLSRVANIRSVQMRKLERADVTTMKGLCDTALTRVPKMASKTLDRLRLQARLQIESAGLDLPKFELIPHDHKISRRGLGLLPPASSQDVFFDMEGYPYVDGGLEYLFGASYTDEKGDLQFSAVWAHDRQQEKESFEKFVDWVYARWIKDPSMHVYHYADYEVSALRRLMGRHGTRESQVDNLLRCEVFVDLYTVVRQCMQVGTPSYSLKHIERLYRPMRGANVSNAVDSIMFYQSWLEEPDGADERTSQKLKEIEAYNRDDCDSTAQLSTWLRDLQKHEKIEYTKPKERSAEPTSAAEARNEHARLAAEILINLSDDVEESRVQRLLAYLLEFHWREEKPFWWLFFERRDFNTEQMIEDESCLGGLRLTGAPPRSEKRSMAYQYQFEPGQVTKIDEDQDCYWFDGQVNRPATVLLIDEITGLADVKFSHSTLSEQPPPAELNLIPADLVKADTIARSIYRVVSSWRQTGQLPPAVDDFLRRRRPNLAGNISGPILRAGDTSMLAEIASVVANMQNTTLCIQGPPGSGKTFSGARIILELVRQGKRVGVTSNSHKAIAKLLQEIDSATRELKVSFKGVKIQNEKGDFHLEKTKFRPANSAADVFGSSSYDIVGGTAWAFSDEAAIGALDYLFVDEAGQVSVANLLGMSPSTKNIVLMGDQMQLSQPTKGSHPEESGMSTLNYLLQDMHTVPDDFGIFLAKTHRMHPDVCSFISHAIYEGRLVPDGRTKERRLVMPANTWLPKSSGITYLPIEHEGNIQGCEEEARFIGEIIAELRRCTYIDEKGGGRLSKDQILVVTPYNMQVRLLKKHNVPSPVGTVDKFQGQEAPVVIVSMCASNGNESARGLDFLFNRNRLNVAISRAKCLAIVVGSPALADTVCTSVEQIKLVNLFCHLAQFEKESTNAHSISNLP